MMVGKRTPEAHYAINIIENSQLLLPLTLFSLAQMTSNLVQRQVLWPYRPYQNLGQIDHNLHNHISDDANCKPPIRSVATKKAASSASAFNGENGGRSG